MVAHIHKNQDKSCLFVSRSPTTNPPIQNGIPQQEMCGGLCVWTNAEVVLLDQIVLLDPCRSKLDEPKTPTDANGVQNG
jgi:hypothetical protein